MSFLTPVLNFLSLGKTRTIKDITGYITISENTVDSLEITQQPVQQGAMITDHSFLKPTLFTAQIQFQEATPLSGIPLVGGVVGNLVQGAATLGTLQETYQNLLDLQSLREPFIITTPKRIYKNMLFQSLGLTTDKKTEHVLAISASFLQIVIVSVSNVSVPRIQQKDPGTTGKTQNAGKKSVLFTGASGLFPGVTGFTQ